jgi:hypothetical protein
MGSLIKMTDETQSLEVKAYQCPLSAREEDGYPDKIVLNPDQTQEFLRYRNQDSTLLSFDDMPVIAFYQGKVYKL